jgi:hypothetical protein
MEKLLEDEENMFFFSIQIGQQTAELLSAGDKERPSMSSI